MPVRMLTGMVGDSFSYLAGETVTVTDGIDGTLVVRETARTRGLTLADRVTIAGHDCAIESVPIAHRSGWLSLTVSRL
ncbi:hypothetical protein [Methylobacterium frigidaeris]|uniref:Uncharacterized protein n=1 Tax=Methylobacterium frigidaeris TaxID=2038277 RepID=A0AA37H7W0_9HYPH|nr:hypothetical protein [Methylobacterium frigidaeris]GJD60857.1 hypothetical protein MPEAHAMD_0997 [Methylobacterium frigidaeris]